MAQPTQVVGPWESISAGDEFWGVTVTCAHGLHWYGRQTGIEIGAGIEARVGIEIVVGAMGITSVLREERTNLKEPGIRRDNVTMKIRGVTSTTFLQTRVAEEKHVEGLVGKFIFPRSKIVNKTCAPEDLECWGNKMEYGT